MFGARQAAQHYQFAPNFMTRVQPTGTPGLQGAWNDGTAPIWPGVSAIHAAREAHAAAGEAMDYEVMRRWFTSRYAQWKVDPRKAITVEEVAAMLRSDDTWIKPPVGGFVTSRGEPWLVPTDTGLPTDSMAVE